MKKRSNAVDSAHLVSFAGYLLSKKEGRTGSPEKPLSALGALSYRNYWKGSVFAFLAENSRDGLRLEDISKATSMTLADVFATLQEHQMIETYRTEKQQAVPGAPGGIARQALSRHHAASDSTVLPTDYRIVPNRQAIDDYLAKLKAKDFLQLKPHKLKYTPFLVTRVALGSDGMLESEQVPPQSNEEMEPPAAPSFVIAQPAQVDDESEEDDDEPSEKAAGDDGDDDDFVDPDAEYATPPPPSPPKRARSNAIDSPARKSARQSEPEKTTPLQIRMTRTVAALLTPS